MRQATARPARWRGFIEAAGLPDSAQDPRSAPAEHSAGPRRAAGALGLRGLLSAGADRLRRQDPLPAHDAPGPARDLRMLPAALAAWATAALAVRLDVDAATWLGIGLAVSALACGAVVVGSRKNRSMARVFLILSAAGAMICFPAAAKIEQRSSPPLLSAVAAEAHVTVELKALGDARKTESAGLEGSPRWILEAELQEATFQGKRFSAHVPIVVLADQQWSEVRHGDALRTAGRLSASDAGERAAALLIASTAPAELAEQPRRQDPLGDLRARFLALAAGTGAPDGGLMAGMVIGARSAVDQDLVAQMRATGLTHLTAVSGANCSYVLAFVFVLFRACRLPRWVSTVAAIAALIAFVLLVRPEPSVLRAAVMGSIGVLAILTGRGRLSLVLLFLSIAGLLTADPWLSGEYAFILSVAATCGLILAGPLLAARLGNRMPGWIAQLVAVPLAAQLFCSPVLALIQPNVPLYSLPANIAAAPLVPFITILGMVAVILLVILPWCALPFALAAAWGAAGVASIARFFASAPLSTLPWQPGVGGAVLMAILSGALLAAVVWWLKLRAAAMLLCRSLRGIGFRRAAAAGLWVLGGCLVGAVAVWTAAGYRQIPDWTVAACDVGQGDGFVVRTGDGRAMVFDAGPEPSAMDSCLDRLGVRTVEVLVLTHLHEDHYGGIAGVFADRSVRRVVYSTAEDALPRRVAETTTAAGIQPERVFSGAGDEQGTVGWSVLWPTDSAPRKNENNASAVVLVSVAGGGRSEATTILFTGDLEEDAVGGLLAANPQLSTDGVDILKVAHHGARNGGSRIIQELAPRVALLSAGEGNEYGHPHPETLDVLEAADVHVARTDQQGTILLSVEGESIRVRSAR